MEAPLSGCTKQGWLVKKGKTTNRLWFELWGDALIYYTNRIPPRKCAHSALLNQTRSCLQDVGSITLSENTVIQDPRILPGRGWIEISKRLTSYFLRAADDKDTTSWTDALEQAVKKRQGAHHPQPCSQLMHLVEAKSMGHAIRVIFLLALDRTQPSPSRLALIPLDLLGLFLNRLLPPRCTLPIGTRRSEFSHMVGVATALRDLLRQGMALRFPRLAVPDSIRPADARRGTVSSTDTTASPYMAEVVP